MQDLAEMEIFLLYCCHCIDPKIKNTREIKLNGAY